MITSTGAQGSWRRVLRAASLGSAALLGGLAVSVGASPVHRGTSHTVLAGYGSSAGRSFSAAVGKFKIAGSIGTLFPGSSRTLKLTVTNPQTFAIVVTSITTVVHSASASCTAGNLSVSAFSGKLSVPAAGSAKVDVFAELSYSAPEACVGSTFPLVYSGIGKA